MIERELSPECEAVQPELGAYVDAELPAKERAAVGRHLEGCAACSEEEALLRLITQSLSLAPRPEPSEAMRQRLLAQVTAELPGYRITVIYTERHSDQVIQWREVRTIRRPASPSRLAAEPAPATPALLQQSRREQVLSPGLYQVIESLYGR